MPLGLPLCLLATGASCIQAAGYMHTLNTPTCLSASVCMFAATQLSNMEWALLQLGRRLVLPAGFAAAWVKVTAYEQVLQCRDRGLDVRGSMAFLGHSWDRPAVDDGEMPR